MLILKLIANGGGGHELPEVGSDLYQFLAFTLTMITTIVGAVVTVITAQISSRKDVYKVSKESRYKNTLLTIKGQIIGLSYYQDESSREGKVFREIRELIGEVMEKDDI